ncbi:MAG: hypothetical protein RLZZ601_718 [Pseudomonadota bacterium]|jgi:DNA-binding phage protein
MRGSSKSYEDSLTLSLTNPQEMAAYLDAVVELGDQDALLVALRQATKARGVEIASLLGDSKDLTLDVMSGILHSIGLVLGVTKIHA